MADKKDTREKVISVCARVLRVEDDAIDAQKTFDQLGIDSLDKVEMVMRLEEAFNIHIDDDEFEAFAHIQGVVDYVHDLRN